MAALVLRSRAICFLASGLVVSSGRSGTGTCAGYFCVSLRIISIYLAKGIVDDTGHHRLALFLLTPLQSAHKISHDLTELERCDLRALL